MHPCCRHGLVGGQVSLPLSKVSGSTTVDDVTIVSGQIVITLRSKAICAEGFLRKAKRSRQNGKAPNLTNGRRYLTRERKCDVFAWTNVIYNLNHLVLRPLPTTPISILNISIMVGLSLLLNFQTLLRPLIWHAPSETRLIFLSYSSHLRGCVAVTYESRSRADEERYFSY